MKIKSFYSDSMDGAIQTASRELGDEALILNSRETPKEFQHFGRYEVVCAVTHQPEPESPATRAPLTRLPSPIQTASGRLVALVGPSGAGKSSACAKIALNAKLHQSLKPAVISWDTSRVGGSHLLYPYCEIAGIPFVEVSTASGFEQALDQLASHALILIDTPSIEGESGQLAEVSSSLRSHPETEVHLVLSGAYSPSYLRSSLETYARLGVKYLLPTHLDQSRMELAAPEMEPLRELPIRWCSTGRAIPEALEDATLVMEKAAALSLPVPDQEGFAIATMEFRSLPPKSTVESILARFRRSNPESSQTSSGKARSSVA